MTITLMVVAVDARSDDRHDHGCRGDGCRGDANVVMAVAIDDYRSNDRRAG